MLQMESKKCSNTTDLVVLQMNHSDQNGHLDELIVLDFFIVLQTGTLHEIQAVSLTMGKQLQFLDYLNLK